MKLKTEEVKLLLKRGMKVAEIAKKFNVTRQAVYAHKYRLEKKKNKKDKQRKSYKNLIDWHAYNEGLVKRGEILLDIEIFELWEEEIKFMNQNKRGAPFLYPESFIIFLANIKSAFGIDYRTLEGIMRKLTSFINKKAPDYTTIQKRFEKLNIKLKVYQQKDMQEVAIDSTGLKTTKRGEYKMNKYKGERKKYIKLHIMVNIQTKQVISCSVTEEFVSDNKEFLKLLQEGEKYGKIKEIFGDSGYDSILNYEICRTKNITPHIKPRRTMKKEKVEEKIYARGIMKYKWKRGKILRLLSLKEYLTCRDGWVKTHKYGKRWTAETEYSAFKRVFGESVYSKKLENCVKEIILKLSLLNLYNKIKLRSYDYTSSFYKKRFMCMSKV